MSQKLLEAAKRFAAPESPVQHDLTTQVSGMTYIAECSCGNWNQYAPVTGYYAPFDVMASHQHHVLLSNYAAGVAQPEKMR